MQGHDGDFPAKGIISSGAERRSRGKQRTEELRTNILHMHNIKMAGARVEKKNISLLFLFLLSAVNGHMTYIQYLFWSL